MLPRRKCKKLSATYLGEALATVHSTGERWWEAVIQRLRGELLLRQAVGKWESRATPTATAGFNTADLKAAKARLDELP
jgi:predicted negative regulator of RcsB-dependent stress response